MAVSILNKNISIKVSKGVYEYLKSFSDEFGVSISSLSEHFITISILMLDHKLDSDPEYINQFIDTIKSYDLRRNKNV